MLGGIVIALVEVFWADWVGSAYKDVAAFSILVLILIFMPQGLLGRLLLQRLGRCARRIRLLLGLPRQLQGPGPSPCRIPTVVLMFPALRHQHPDLHRYL